MGTFGYNPAPPNALQNIALQIDPVTVGTITLRGLQFVPVPGYHVPKIARLGLEPTSCGPAPSRGWPPTLPCGKRTQMTQVSPFAGSTIQVGGPDFIRDVIVDVVRQPQPMHGGRPVTYAWAGFEITYLLEGALFTTPVYQGGDVCFAVRASLCPSAMSNAVSNAIMQAQPSS